MYINLNECLKRKGISINAAAALVHIEEAFIVKDNLFPELELRYLFEKQ